MTDGMCAWVADRLPDLEAGTLAAAEAGAAEAHLRSCAACRAERDVVLTVRGARPTAPLGLAAAVLAALDAPAARQSGVRRLPSWTYGARPLLAAAAVTVFLVGGVLWLGDGELSDDELLADASVEAPAVAALPGEDGLLAGAPVLADLSEEELELLLEELET